MSYDLLVFDPAFAPTDREAFLRWYGQLTRWDEPVDYNSPDVLTDATRPFYDLLRQTYPPMNGPHAPDDGIDAKVADYVLTPHAIYLAFAYSIAKVARRDVTVAATQTGLGLFYVSDDEGEIVRPG